MCIQLNSSSIDFKSSKWQNLESKPMMSMDWKKDSVVKNFFTSRLELNQLEWTSLTWLSSMAIGMDPPQKSWRLSSFRDSLISPQLTSWRMESEQAAAKTLKNWMAQHLCRKHATQVSSIWWNQWKKWKSSVTTFPQAPQALVFCIIAIDMVVCHTHGCGVIQFGIMRWSSIVHESCIRIGKFHFVPLLFLTMPNAMKT